MDFKTKLKEAFERHIFMKNRNQHTVNELLYVLDTDELLDGDDYNISVRNLSGEWWSIPCSGCFVNLAIRGVWFNDDEIEFEVENVGQVKYNCFTIYEAERERENEE